MQVWGKCNCGANIRYDMNTCSECGENNPIYLGDNNNIVSWIAREIARENN